ncbi:N-acetylglucosaminylphosphatidylinositol deacetylase superfamily [Streptococcus pneumoniae]|nr:N-acetylglucosaminylphosphatidylinositol deacetylase superfamily [Streptococcus pneumoniae]
MSNNTKYIFLSPHLDDAIFSCGDYISKLTSEGEIVLVITIFSGYPLSQQLQPSAKHFISCVTLGNIRLKKGRKKTG